MPHFLVYLLDGMGQMQGDITNDVSINKEILKLWKKTRTNLSHTPDRDFHCFYPCEIILSHIPIPARQSMTSLEC